MSINLSVSAHNLNCAADFSDADTTPGSVVVDYDRFNAARHCEVRACTIRGVPEARARRLSEARAPDRPSGNNPRIGCAATAAEHQEVRKSKVRSGSFPAFCLLLFDSRELRPKYCRFPSASGTARSDCIRAAPPTLNPKITRGPR